MNCTRVAGPCATWMSRTQERPRQPLTDCAVPTVTLGDEGEDQRSTLQDGPPLNPMIDPKPP